MREYELVIDEALRNGLSPFDMTPFNTQVLSGCLGLRIGKAGPEVFETKSNPLPATVDMYYDWPFPQYITGELYNILVVRDTINQEDVVYSVSDDHSTVNFVFAVDKLTFGEGSLMKVADFGEYIFMANGVCMIYWDPSGPNWVATTGSTTIPLMTTICNFKGQAVGGGIKSAWHDCDETFYVWSKIGEMDFTPDNFNTAGYRRCPYGGTVLDILRLRNKVVGYSSKGITLMTPVDDPTVTLGFTEVDDVGLLNSGAVNGSKKRHVYVGEDYILRQITGEGIRELGYRPFMEELSTEDIIVSYDPVQKDFYIGNSIKTFLFSSKGLSEIPQHPSAVWRRNKTTYMIPDVEDSYDCEIVSNDYDMTFKGNKTIFSIESDIFNVDDPEVNVEFKNDLNSVAWAGDKPMNNQGIASYIISGNSFKIKLKFSPDYLTTRIGFIKARYKMTDLKGIRGVYAPPPRGQ